MKGSRVQGSHVQGSRVQGSRVQGSRVQGSRVQGSSVQGSRVQVLICTFKFPVVLLSMSVNKCRNIIMDYTCLVVGTFTEFLFGIDDNDSELYILSCE